MQRKYISIHILLACRSEQTPIIKDIHAQLQETIAERKRILSDWESLFLDDSTDAASIHRKFRATIAGLKRTNQQYAGFFATQKDNIYDMINKQAA